MLFDIRGRRKHVIRVVYAVLALLMGASLFLVVGPFNLGELAGGGSAEDAAEVLDEQAERTEANLRREPNNEALQIALVRSRIAAGNAEMETDTQTGAPIITSEARQDFDRAVEAWSTYLKQTDEVNPSVALLVADTYFNIAESSRSLAEIEENLSNAADTQRLAAEAVPSVGTLSSLATYEYYAGDFAAGDRTAKRAESKAPKGQDKQVKSQMAEFRKRAKSWEAETKRIAKLEAEQGKEGLQSPFGGLGGGSASLGE